VLAVHIEWQDRGTVTGQASGALARPTAGSVRSGKRIPAPIFPKNVAIFSQATGQLCRKPRQVKGLNELSPAASVPSRLCPQPPVPSRLVPSRLQPPLSPAALSHVPGEGGPVPFRKSLRPRKPISFPNPCHGRGLGKTPRGGNELVRVSCFATWTCEHPFPAPGDTPLLASERQRRLPALIRKQLITLTLWSGALPGSKLFTGRGWQKYRKSDAMIAPSIRCGVASRRGRTAQRQIAKPFEKKPQGLGYRRCRRSIRPHKFVAVHRDRCGRPGVAEGRPSARINRSGLPVRRACQHGRESP
jgi:hypothetical protein